MGLLSTGCTTIRNLTGKLPPLKVRQTSVSVPATSSVGHQPFAFMDPLPIRQDDKKDQQPRWTLKSSSNSFEVVTADEKIAAPPSISNPSTTTIFSKEGEVSSLQLKFSVLLEQELTSLPDSKLLAAIDPWMGVRYRNGGTSSQGIDCSAFTASVLSTYAGIRLPRTCREQYQQYPSVNKDEIQIGDLLFFRTRGRSVSHVGIYLGNNKFVHASSSNGVMVSSKSEPYFSSRFVGARRVPIGPATGSAFE